MLQCMWFQTLRTARWGSALVALVALIHTSAPGQIVLTPQREGGLYGPGQAAGWTITSASQSTSATLIQYIIRKNGVGEPEEQGTLELTSGSATIEYALTEPGAIHLSVRAPDIPSAENVSNGPGAGARRPGNFRAAAARDGAIFDATRIGPSLPRPEDFDAWWGEKLEALDAIPANPELEKVDVGVEGVEYYKITLDNINGTKVRGQLARPAGDGPFPALMQFQYAGVYPLQRQWVTDRARNGWLILNDLAHDMPIDDEAAIKTMADGPLRHYQAIGNSNREDSYFLRMYLGDCRALQYLASRSDWNGQTLVVMGDSMGGQQSMAAVGLVGGQCGVTHMICHVPSGCDVGAAGNGRAMAYPNWPNQPDIIQTARYFDPVNFASRIQAKTLISFGLFDTTSPPTGVLAAFNQIPAPKELLPLHSDHGGPGQRPRDQRREAWLARLVAGEPVILEPR